MKKTKLILIFFLFIYSKLFSQEFSFGIINDDDGFVNVRKEKSTNSKIIDKLSNGEIVYFFYEKEYDKNWLTISYIKNNKEITGEVYIDRVTPISDFPNLKLKNNTDEFAQYQNDTITIDIKLEKFISKDHIITYSRTYKNVIDKVDGEEYFGCDGTMPKNQFKSITLNSNNLKLEIPKKHLKNLYQIDFSIFEIYVDNKNNSIYIYFLGGDGAGGYASLITIKNNKKVSRFITIPF